jgi:hypothetical protein
LGFGRFENSTGSNPTILHLKALALRGVRKRAWKAQPKLMSRR